MAEAELAVEFMHARFISPCPFCGRGIAVGTLIRRSEETGEWCHPDCSRAIDKGQSFRDFQHEYRVRQRAKELGILKPARRKGKRRRSATDDSIF